MPMALKLMHSRLFFPCSFSRTLLNATRYISCTSKFPLSSEKETDKNASTNDMKSSQIGNQSLNIENTDKETNFSIDGMILSSTSSAGHEDGARHSEDGNDDFEYANDDDIAAQILSVALEYVPTYGWSDRAIEEAVKSLDLSPSSAGIFKRGGVDLVLHFIEECNNALSEHMSENSRSANNNIVSTSDFIEEAVKMRLKMIIPYIDTWPQALTLLASPIAVADCLENGANMVDEIWYHAGDVSTDMNWYTKRAALAAVYASTEIYMLRDNSVEFADTWDFLHRRLEDFKAAEITKNSCANAMNDFYALASAGFTTAQNILGMNSRKR
ncbi:ubiquinone biosynthesis protein COQ9-B, mitochondrial-like [Hydractinia symbiolongicarpus]|uniref:ubiquinone biosynthesis protein COQ9-B, mitochondrial-like n=1 Tax=Hydractinia symbiolongicarpus TaxID=13093 RepID=UPI00254F1643|nr:ubiquinone biosynthesis protein COQ9-B, mitochondrial-like [Hydractinia symbiolongicarpus]